MVEAPVTDKINIQLGDIIEIDAPTDQEVHNTRYFVKFIGSKQIQLIKEDGSSESTLFINDDGGLRNEAITGVNILSRATTPGYATQNDLVPQTWIDIYFDGDVPVVITGKITNLEEDMIEITTHPDNDVLYIDFAYKGIPEDIPIEKILIREEPGKSKTKPETETEVIMSVGRR